MQGLFELLAAVPTLEFAGFSNPEIWNPSRLLSGELLQRANLMPWLKCMQLIEYLDADTVVFKKGAYKDEKLVMVIEGSIRNVKTGEVLIR